MESSRLIGTSPEEAPARSHRRSSALVLCAVALAGAGALLAVAGGRAAAPGEPSAIALSAVAARTRKHSSTTHCTPLPGCLSETASSDDDDDDTAAAAADDSRSSKSRSRASGSVAYHGNNHGREHGGGHGNHGQVHNHSSAASDDAASTVADDAATVADDDNAATVADDRGHASTVADDADDAATAADDAATADTDGVVEIKIPMAKASVCVVVFVLRFTPVPAGGGHNPPSNRSIDPSISVGAVFARPPHAGGRPLSPSPPSIRQSRHPHP